MQPNLFVPELGKFQLSGKVCWCLFAGYELLVVVALTLGELVGANCIAIKVLGEDGQSKIVRMGFWCECNHGPLYLIGIPIFFLCTILFLKQADRTFSSLENSGAFSNSSNAALVSTITLKTKKTWVLISVLIFVLVSSVEFTTELTTLAHTKQVIENTPSTMKGRPEVVIGWVQAQYISAWAKALESGHIKTEIVIPKSATDNFVKVEVLQGGSDKEGFVFTVFLFVALVVESVAISFGMWVLFKGMWILSLILIAFSGKKPLLLKVEPYFNDDDKRFGLSDLDKVYKSMLWLIILAGLGLAFSISSNILKGTAVIVPGTWKIHFLWQLFPQFLFWIVPALAAVAILVGPPLLASSLREAQRQRYNEINKKRYDAVKQNDIDGQNKYNKEIAALESQTVWSWIDKTFKFQVTFVVVLFVMLPASFVSATLVQAPAEIIEDVPEKLLLVLKQTAELTKLVSYGVENVRKLVYILCGHQD